MKSASLKRMIFAVLVTLVLSTVCSALTLTPGLNVLTGTEKPFDFEGDVSSVVFSNEATETENAVVTYATSANPSNKAAALSKAKAYFYFKDFPTIEKERPVNYSFDYVYGGQLRITLNGDTTGTYALLYKYINGGKTDKWASTPFTSNGRKSADGLTTTSDLKYQGGEDITSLYFMNYSGSAATSYFDNISIVPAYKLSFDLNGGVGNAEDVYTFDKSYSTFPDKTAVARAGHTLLGWALSPDSTQTVSSVTFTAGQDATLYAVWQENADDTTKLVELYDGEELVTFYYVTKGKNRTLPDNTLVDGKRLYGWLSEDGKTLHGYNILSVDEDMKLYAQYHEDVTKPGINVFGDGSFETESFQIRPSNGYVKTVKLDDGNSVLAYTRGSGFESIQHRVIWDYGRKYKVSYKFKADYKAGINNNAVFSEIKNNQDGTTSEVFNHLFGQSTANADSWYTYSGTYTFNYEDYTVGEKDAISFYYNPDSDGKGRTIYYDDLEFVPYYKVTYVAEGASGVPETEYFLADKYTVSDKEPSKSGCIFAGWSLSPDSVKTVTEVVPTKGEDITLYAVFESITQKEAIAYTFKSTYPGIANGTITVKCPEEIAAYTNIEVYLADDDGIMTQYTPFATMTVEEGTAVYNVTGNRGFPIGATRLAFVFSAEGMEKVTYWYTIPEAHRFDGNDRSLKLKFWATSDLHLSGSNYNSDYWPEMTKNRNNAMEDIFASDADLAFINGDVVNYGHSRFPELLTSYLNDRINNDSYNVSKMPVFLTNGNHEYMNNDSSLPSTNGGFDFDPIQGVIMGQLDYIAKNYPDIKITHDGESMWYAADIKGVKFIFLSSPEEKASGDSMTYTVSEGQLEFLDYQLYESEASNKTAVVVTHVPLDKYVPADSDTGYQAGISNTSAVEQILAMHPNTLFCTGHSHSDIGDEDTHFVVTGDMTEKFTHLNDGCLVWIDPTDGVGENGTAYIKSYSTGMYIETYNDLIVVRGRKFLDESKYFGHAVYLIPTQDRDRGVVKAEISKDFVYGNETFDAVAGDEEEYTYSWIIDGAVVGTEKTLTLTENADYEGKYLYLRATDKDGYYVTTKSAYPYMTVKEIDAGQKCENPKTVFVPFGEDYSGKYVTVAVYDGNDTLCALKFVTDSTKLLKININPALDAKTVKVMVLDNLSSLVPVCENKTIAVD